MTPCVCLLQEAAKAAAGLEQAQAQVQQHQEAIGEARRLQGDASAALVSLSLRCEGLADALASESTARKVGNSAEHAVLQVTWAHDGSSWLLSLTLLVMRMLERACVLQSQSRGCVQVTCCRGALGALTSQNVHAGQRGGAGVCAGGCAGQGQTAQ